MLFRPVRNDSAAVPPLFALDQGLLSFSHSGGTAAKTLVEQRKSIAFPQIDGHSPECGDPVPVRGLVLEYKSPSR